MSVSSLISQFSKASSLTESTPPQTPDSSQRGSLGRRHYSTSSIGSSRSESPVSCGTHSPRPDDTPTRHMSIGNDSTRPQKRLTSITEDKIRMFNSRCVSSTEGTDGPPRSRSKTVPSRQMSAGSNDIGRETELKVPARRQLSAPGSGSRGRSPSPFRLPGMASSGKRRREGRESSGRKGPLWCSHLIIHVMPSCIY